MSFGLEQVLSPPLIATVVVIIAVAGLAHGTLGFGFPLVSTPLVALLVDIKTAVLVTVLPNIAVNIISILRGGNWRASIGRYWPLAAWVVLGTLLGSWVRKRHALAAFVFGVTAGVLSGAVNVALPPLVIYLMTQELTPIALTQTLNLCFIAGKTAQALALGISDAPSRGLLYASLPLIPLAGFTVYAGMRVQSRIGAEAYVGLLRIALGAIAAALVLQVVWSLARGG
jgi:uncharacterized membrane protein YfcA